MTQQRQMTEPSDPSQIRFDVQEGGGHPPLPLVGVLPMVMASQEVTQPRMQQTAGGAGTKRDG